MKKTSPFAHLHRWTAYILIALVGVLVITLVLQSFIAAGILEDQAANIEAAAAAAQ